MGEHWMAVDAGEPIQNPHEGVSGDGSLKVNSERGFGGLIGKDKFFQNPLVGAWIKCEVQNPHMFRQCCLELVPGKVELPR